MSDDLELLRRFARERDEAAFAEVVHRNIDFVYRTALRQVNADSHLAQDVTQAVFLQLAKKAGDVAGHRVLAGWLHHTARFCARSAIRTERRWQKREQEAQTMINESRDPAADWTQFHPVLDEVLQEIEALDREALLMRFYENHPFAALGARLGLTENAARMRVDRALEKLRARLAHRGITSTTAALASVMANQPAFSAPSALASLVIQSSLAGMAVAGGTGAATAATFTLMSTTKILATGAAIAALFAIGYYAGSNQPPGPAAVDAEALLRNQLTQARQENRSLAAEVARLRAAAETPTVLAPVAPAPLQAVAAVIPYNPVAPPRLEGNAATAPLASNAIMNNLRQIGAAASQFRLEKGRDPTSIDELVGTNAYIKAINPADSESYTNLDFSRGGTLTVVTAGGVAISYGGSAGSTPPKTPFQLASDRARAAFSVANGGRSPVGYEMADYFDEPSFREAYVDTTRVMAIRQHLDPGLMPAMEKASKAFETAYKAAYGGVSPPQTFQAFEHLASFIENDDDRARYVATLNRVTGQGGQ